MLHLYPEHHGLHLSTILLLADPCYSLRAENHPQLTGIGVQSMHWPFEILSSLMGKYRTMPGIHKDMDLQGQRGYALTGKGPLAFILYLWTAVQLTNHQSHLYPHWTGPNEHTLPRLNRRFRCVIYYLFPPEMMWKMMWYFYQDLSSTVSVDSVPFQAASFSLLMP